MTSGSINIILVQNNFYFGWDVCIIVVAGAAAMIIIPQCLFKTLILSPNKLGALN